MTGYCPISDKSCALDYQHLFKNKMSDKHTYNLKHIFVFILLQVIQDSYINLFLHTSLTNLMMGVHNVFSSLQQVFQMLLVLLWDAQQWQQ